MLRLELPGSVFAMPGVVVVGSFVQDLVFRTETFPNPGETRIGTFGPSLGGKGFNQAVACCRQNSDTFLVGAVGRDVFAENARSFAAEIGLKTRFQVCEDSATGAASILVDASGENQIVVALGANEALSPNSVEGVRAEIAQADIALCQLEVSLGATRRLLEIAREEGTASILNVAPINQEATFELIRLADILTPNETEFAFVFEKLLGEPLPPSFLEGSDEQLHALCCRLGVPVVVVTLGSAGSFISLNPAFSDRPYSIGGDSYRRYASLSVSPVDTTGAGDAFNGGLAAGLSLFAMDLDRAARFATVVAGLSVEKAGAAVSMPSYEDVAARLASCHA